jgi:2-polyprenyl-3-methyl-5-hydroxy-6-metoxy-1,4-benzoquinol methylase
MKELIAENYGWLSGSPEHSHSYLLPASIQILQEHGVKSMLDIGTGNGATIPVWLSQGLNVAAMEPDNDGFFYSSKHDKADVRQLGVGEPLPPEWNNAFDAIVCLEVVEHLFDPVSLVKAASQTLKAGGIAIISTPYHGYIKNLCLAFANKWDFHHHPLRSGGHIKFWSRKTLSKLFRTHGYKELSFRGVGRLPYLWKSMIIVFHKPY